MMFTGMEMMLLAVAAMLMVAISLLVAMLKEVTLRLNREVESRLVLAIRYSELADRLAKMTLKEKGKTGGIYEETTEARRLGFDDDGQAEDRRDGAPGHPRKPH